MKKFSKIISLLLVFCICFSLLPMTVAFADDYITRGKEVPSDFRGHVVSYNVENESKGIIRLDVGVRAGGNTLVMWAFGMSFDSDVLSFCKPDGTVLTSLRTYKNSLVSADIPSGIVLDNGEGWIGQDIIGGDFALIDYYDTPVFNVDSDAKVGYFAVPLTTAISSDMQDVIKGYKGSMWSVDEQTDISFYSIYLKLKDDKKLSDITSDTITMLTDDSRWNGWVDDAKGSIIINNDGKAESENTYMLNFPEETYEVKFTVKSGDDTVSGAAITVKDATDTTKTYSVDTKSDGTATLKLPKGTYKYTVQKTNYETSAEATVSITGAKDIEVNLTKKVTTYKIKWKFVDEEGSPVEAITVCIDGTQKCASNRDGEAECELPAGTYAFTTRSDAGYEPLEEQLVVNAAQSLNKVVKKTPLKTYEVKVKVVDAYDGTTPIEGAKVVIYSGDPVTRANGDKVVEAYTDATGYATFNLVEGSYYCVVSRGILYKTSAPVPFDVGEGNTTVALVELVKSTTSGEPQYFVEGKYDEDSGKYKVDVTLKNANAVGASFGLKWDNRIFKLTDTDPIVYKNTEDIEIAQAYEGDSGGYAAQQNEDGYVTFGWYAKNENRVIEADSEGVALVSYTFDIIDDDWEDNVCGDTFSAVKWTDTEQGKDDEEELYKDIWNAETGNYVGMLLTKTEGSTGYSDDMYNEDIKMVFDYKNIERCRLTFIVKEKDATDPEVFISGAKINVYDASGEELGENLGPLTTDGNGKADVVVDAGSYKYDVSADRYWPSPAQDEDSDETAYNETGEIEAGKEFVVELEPKEYKDVNVSVKNGTIISGTKSFTDSDTTDDDAESEDWAEQAVVGADFKFATTPVEGFVIDGKPQYKIGADTEAWTDASFNRENETWFIPKEQITDKVFVKVNYKADSFTVTANRNAGGSLKWGEDDITELSKEKPFEKGENSGKLLFKADEGNVIYKVVINGAVYPLSETITEFEYEFEDITRNNTISVLFMDEDAEHPEEYVVSVIAGKYGKIDVSYGDTPTTDTVDGDSSKDYILAWDETLTAKVTPDSEPDDGYEIDRVLLDGVAQDLGEDRTTYSQEIVASAEAQTFAATFRVKGSEESIQYLISTVVTGGGMTDPFGSKLYYAYETPTYTFTANDLWKIKSVVLSVDGTEDDKGDISEYTFSSGVPGNVVIKVTFGEFVRNVAGVVKYAQGNIEVSDMKTPTNPKVVFERTSDGATFEATISEVAATSVLTGEKTSNFTAELPTGTYKVTASKDGHLSYVITDFEVSIDASDVGEDDVEPVADVDDILNIDGVMELIPGNTNNDNYITFFDILRVVNGYVRYADGYADVDENGIVDVSDLNFTKANYGLKKVEVNYETHKASMSTPEE